MHFEFSTWSTKYDNTTRGLQQVQSRSFLECSAEILTRLLFVTFQNAPPAVKVSREEDGDEGEYAVVRALGFKVRCLLSYVDHESDKCSQLMLKVACKITTLVVAICAILRSN